MKNNIILLFNSLYYSNEISIQIDIIHNILDRLNKLFIYDNNIDNIIEFQILHIKIIDIKIGKKIEKLCIMLY